jgi:hypothetical protein
MLRKNGITPVILGVIIIASVAICKYFNTPMTFLLIITIVCILYQLDTNRKNNISANFEDTLVNLSRFIIVTGISGYIVVRIVGIFVTGFN